MPQSIGFSAGQFHPERKQNTPTFYYKTKKQTKKNNKKKPHIWSTLVQYFWIHCLPTDPKLLKNLNYIAVVHLTVADQ